MLSTYRGLAQVVELQMVLGQLVFNVQTMSLVNNNHKAIMTFDTIK